MMLVKKVLLFFFLSIPCIKIIGILGPAVKPKKAQLFHWNKTINILKHT